MTPDLLVKGFDALQYVTNPYALFGYVVLAGIVAIGVVVKRQGPKVVLLAAFAILALGASYKLLDTTLNKIRDGVLVHLVKDASRVRVSPGVEVELLDIETLKGEDGWEFNSKLKDAGHVFDEVFRRAGLSEDGSDFQATMNAETWREFMVKLENSQDADQKLQAEKIKDIPFAGFRVFVDGVEDARFRDKYCFKNEKFCIPSGSSDGVGTELEVVNLYNTKHKSSGEPEAANVRVFPR